MQKCGIMYNVESSDRFHLPYYISPLERSVLSTSRMVNQWADIFAEGRMSNWNESGIYEIVNILNGHRYIGRAVNFNARWRCHKSDLRRGIHHSKYLQHAWDKYGEDAFKFRVMFYCGKDMLIYYEQLCLDNLHREYCVSNTSDFPVAYGQDIAKGIQEKCTPEGRKQRAIYASSFANSEEARAKKSLSFSITLSDPTVHERMSTAQKEVWNRPGYKSNWMESRVNFWDRADDERRIELSKIWSDAGKNRWKNPEYRLNNISKRIGNSNNKLSHIEVKQVDWLYFVCNYPAELICIWFGVGATTVFNIIHRRYYKNVERFSGAI